MKIHPFKDVLGYTLVNKDNTTYLRHDIVQSSVVSNIIG